MSTASTLLALLPAPGRVLYADFDEIFDLIREETLITALDFDRDGQIDIGPAQRIRIAPSAEIDAALGGTSGIYPKPIPGPPYPYVLTELAQWGMLWRLGRLAHKIATGSGIDPQFYYDCAHERLKLLRTAKLGLDDYNGASAPVGKNHGGVVLPREPFRRDQPPPRFANDGKGRWGIF
jgi:phage gp36-like protein